MDFAAEILGLRRELAELRQEMSGSEDIGAGAGGAELTPVQITGGSGENHIANVHENGTHYVATESGVTLKVMNIAATESLALNQWEDAWKQTWDNGGVDEEYWTINPKGIVR